MKTKSMTLKRMLGSLLQAATLGLLLCASSESAQAQHGHLNAGALGTAQGDKLYFANGDIFAASSGYVKQLTQASTGPYAGYFEGNITLTSLAATTANGGPAAGAPALGSFVEVQIASVQGPGTGTFSFWEEGALTPTFSVKSGSSLSSPLWALSDAENGAGTAGADPYGHLHGRRFTTDIEGLYTVGFRLVDTSKNGADGGPIHAASDVLYIQFQAVPEPTTLAFIALGGLAIAGIRTRKNRA